MKIAIFFLVFAAVVFASATGRYDSIEGDHAGSIQMPSSDQAGKEHEQTPLVSNAYTSSCFGKLIGIWQLYVRPDMPWTTKAFRISGALLSVFCFLLTIGIFIYFGVKLDKK